MDSETTDRPSDEFATIAMTKASFRLTSVDGDRAALRRLIFELSDLKRVTSASFRGSLAEHRYSKSLRRLVAFYGDPEIDDAMRQQAIVGLAEQELAHSIIATRASAMGVETLQTLGMDAGRATECLSPAIDEHALAYGPVTASRLRSALQDQGIPVALKELSPEAMSAVDEVFDRLCREPRSGATAIGKSRILVTPTESHADHCYLTAVVATLFACGVECLDDDRERVIASVFQHAMLHHVHNAYLPDGGFGGECLLGDDLADVLDLARQRAIDRLGREMQQPVTSAAQAMTHLDDVVSKLVNASDAIDRVLQTRFHELVATYNGNDVMRELDLVHAGPLQSFQNDALSEMGLL